MMQINISHYSNSCNFDSFFIIKAIINYIHTVVLLDDVLDKIVGVKVASKHIHDS